MTIETADPIPEFIRVFERKRAIWGAFFENGSMGEDYAEISPDEVVVFRVSKEEYPSMVALWQAYEEIKDIGSMRFYDNDLCAAIHTALGFPSPKDTTKIAVAEFQALGQLVGISHQTSRNMFHKVVYREMTRDIPSNRCDIGKDLVI